jgi:predicted deacylase
VVAAPTLDYYIPCPCDGIWEPTVPLGVDVRTGELLGRIHDFDDHTSEPVEIRAARDGVLLMEYLGAVVKKGETLFVVGEEVDL